MTLKEQLKEYKKQIIVLENKITDLIVGGFADYLNNDFKLAERIEDIPFERIGQQICYELPWTMANEIHGWLGSIGIYENRIFHFKHVTIVVIDDHKACVRIIFSNQEAFDEFWKERKIQEWKAK